MSDDTRMSEDYVSLETMEAWGETPDGFAPVRVVRRMAQAALRLTAHVTHLEAKLTTQAALIEAAKELAHINYDSDEGIFLDERIEDEAGRFEEVTEREILERSRNLRQALAALDKPELSTLTPIDTSLIVEESPQVNGGSELSAKPCSTCGGEGGGGGFDRNSSHSADEYREYPCPDYSADVDLDALNVKMAEENVAIAGEVLPEWEGAPCSTCGGEAEVMDVDRFRLHEDDDGLVDDVVLHTATVHIEDLGDSVFIGVRTAAGHYHLEATSPCRIMDRPDCGGDGQ